MSLFAATLLRPIFTVNARFTHHLRTAHAKHGALACETMTLNAGAHANPSSSGTGPSSRIHLKFKAVSPFPTKTTNYPKSPGLKSLIPATPRTRERMCARHARDTRLCTGFTCGRFAECSCHSGGQKSWKNGALMDPRELFT